MFLVQLGSTRRWLKGMQARNHFPLILYDGQCALCNGFVKIILQLDRKNQFYFAALQTEIGKYYLGLNQIDSSTDSIVLINNDKAFIYDDAAFIIAALLGFPANLLLIGKILPKSMRRKTYLWVASNRYKWFGKYDSCPLPAPKYKGKFL